MSHHQCHGYEPSLTGGDANSSLCESSSSATHFTRSTISSTILSFTTSSSSCTINTYHHIVIQKMAQQRVSNITDISLDAQCRATVAIIKQVHSQRCRISRRPDPAHFWGKFPSDPLFSFPPIPFPILPFPSRTRSGRHVQL